MKLFDVYPLFDIEPVEAKGSYVYDKDGTRYLDFYGGHAVISIGHSHPYYVEKICNQLHKIAFYSNSVKNSLQEELAEKLGKLSGYDSYNLFLCNSGAEANENALKLASFHTSRKKVIAFSGSFHGRTSLAVAATDDPKIQANVNSVHEIEILPFGCINAINKINEDVCAVIIEGIQGVGGVQIPDDNYLKLIEQACWQSGALLILDEVQSGYARSGKFFAHQHADITPDMITVAKGMGNGFPVAGVLISPKIEAKHSMLGTTFGGNHLACAAAIAVLDVIEKENLLENASIMGNYLMDKLKGFPGVKEVRGRGLMIGVEMETACADVRNQLLKEHKIFTGSSSNKNTLRLLPALNISKAEADMFLEAFEKTLVKKTTEKEVAA